MEKAKDIEKLLAEMAELKAQLFEANNIIDAIKEGSIDALVVNKDGKSDVYSMESADYTYRILIEKFGEGALSISTEGLILYCNEYFSKLIGIPADKILGTYFDAYVDSADDFVKLKSALVKGPSKSEIVLNASGKKIHVYASLTDLNPMLSAIGIVITDLSEKRKQEEVLAQNQRQLEIKINELNQTNSSLEQFIHVISHDIKEPLRKIIAYSSHLNDNKENNLTETELRNLKVISNSSLRLNSLVDDLVKYAFSTTKVDLVKVDLNSILKEVKDDLELVIEESGAEIICAEVPTITASRVQMRQLFSNLINNSIKYRKYNVPVKIYIRAEIKDQVDIHFPENKFHIISLEDNGIGMEQGQLGKIFTIFQRLHMQNEYSGNGIGLAICKKIMENHFGKIEVESKPGQGSTFHLYFPATN